MPTDDTGVVDPTLRDDNEDGTEAGEGAENEGAGTGPAQALPSEGGAPMEPPSEGLLPEDAPLEGDEPAPAEGSEEENAGTPPVKRPVIPDPVFGTGVNEDNLLNPQQKPDSSFLYDTSIAALAAADSYLNGQTVQVTGEVVGDRIFAEFDPGFSWIVLQALDKEHSEVPVFLSDEYIDLIDTYGAYGRKGTTLQVRGTFHLACPDHEGLTDLHADAVSLVEKGSVTEQVFNIESFIPGFVLVGVGFVLLIVFHRMREGQR